MIVFIIIVVKLFFGACTHISVVLSSVVCSQLCAAAFTHRTLSALVNWPRRGERGERQVGPAKAAQAGAHRSVGQRLIVV